MAAKTAVDRKNVGEQGFLVTMETVVGHVDFHELGEFTPMEAALLVIARSGEWGTFRFPDPGSGEIVTVKLAIGNDNQ